MKTSLFEFPTIELLNDKRQVYITIESNNDSGWIYNNWKGELTKENVLEGATMVLEAIRRTCHEKMLNDNTLVKGSWEGVNHWIETEWTPNAIRLGLKYFAHVLSPDTFAVISAEQMQKNVLGKFEMRLFGDIQQAKEWLSSF